ncbi:MAG: S8 family serine peptidase [Thermoplasmatota archaeon]
MHLPHPPGQHFARILSMGVVAILLLGPVATAQSAFDGSPSSDLTAPGGSAQDACALYSLKVPPGPAVMDALAQLGVTTEESFPVAHTILGCGGDRALASALPFVLEARDPEPIALNLYESRALVHADDVPGGPWVAGQGVGIALVDSGVNASHPGLSNAVSLTVRFTPDGETNTPGPPDAHGTHVAGILAGNGAESDDRRDHGIAPAAHIISLDISDSFTTTNALRAFEWIHEHHSEYNIRVVSNSWGRDEAGARWDPNDPVVRASSALVADGLVVVFSAGNSGAAPGTVTLEGMNPDVITVGATSKSGQLEAYSSRGPPMDANGNGLPWTKPDLVAPGSHILSTRAQPDLSGSGEEAYYVEMSGTSMAAPHVAAAAAEVFSLAPNLTPDIVKQILEGTASPLVAGGPNNESGYGMLNVAAAAKAATTVPANATVQPVPEEIPVHASGQDLTAAGEMANIADPNTLAQAVTVPVAPEDAQSVDLVFAWQGHVASFTGTLTDGTQSVGPFTSEGSDAAISISTTLPPGGPWLFKAQPSAAPDALTWNLDGKATILVQKAVPVGNETREWLSKTRPVDTFFEDQARNATMLDVAGPWDAFVNVIVAAAVGLGALALARKQGGRAKP